ncbi:MAG: globin [Methylococcaceae bacterium]|nr:MAG: globin [Methylococcaceae bacterium]
MSDNKAVRDLVEKSYGICRMTGSFSSDFYDLFLASSPLVREKFADTDMQTQQRMLDQGIRHLIRYFHAPSQVTLDKMQELGRSHSKSRLNIEPALYAIWLDVLLKTVAKHDPDFDDELENAWRKVAEYGITAMLAMYNQI